MDKKLPARPKPGAFRQQAKSLPIAADYLDISPHGKGAVNLGILEIEGDVIRVCSAPAGAPRPTDFSAPEGGRHTFSVWQRA